ncbi:CLUMA_CG012305, isoform A [Clunio marinus]|uniref:CLUMA_CG012305, isoform A n=1 Tax=Clunio marinus TaxID=568069 RepID=A0A1J1IF19_9DIPT|nr:CLUMA_CG012305, isoform A [Clunio marinus]
MCNRFSKRFNVTIIEAFFINPKKKHAKIIFLNKEHKIKILNLPMSLTTIWIASMRFFPACTHEDSLMLISLVG